jgi:hypothetical protein
MFLYKGDPPVAPTIFFRKLLTQEFRVSSSFWRLAAGGWRLAAGGWRLAAF